MLLLDAGLLGMLVAEAVVALIARASATCWAATTYCSLVLRNQIAMT